MNDIPELTEKAFATAIPASIRRRLIAGGFESGDDVERQVINYIRARPADFYFDGVIEVPVRESLN